MRFGDVEIGGRGAPYVIAEIGSNHNGDVDHAIRMIDAAREAGADCVKFQSWTKTSLFAKSIYRDNQRLENQIDAYSVSEPELQRLCEHCREVRIHFACSPFAAREVEFLVETCDVPFIKVASMDLNNYSFLEYIASQGKPVVVSTGLGSLSEIDEAVRTIEGTGNRQIVLLHCVSNYPPEDGDVNLRNIDMLQHNYPEYPVGFSDHSVGTAIPLAAVARGAAVIEKHFTLDKSMDGWDHEISANPDELTALVADGKRVVAATGSYRRVLSAADRRMIPAFRRSVVAARFIPAGKSIELEDLDLKRPGTGIEPEGLPMLVGRTATRDIEPDAVLSLEDL